jgi:hypothetical protein
MHHVARIEMSNVHTYEVVLLCFRAVIQPNPYADPNVSNPDMRIDVCLLNLIQ